MLEWFSVFILWLDPFDIELSLCLARRSLDLVLRKIYNKMVKLNDKKNQILCVWVLPLIKRPWKILMFYVDLFRGIPNLMCWNGGNTENPISGSKCPLHWKIKLFKFWSLNLNIIHRSFQFLLYGLAMQLHVARQ